MQYWCYIMLVSCVFVVGESVYAMEEKNAPLYTRSKCIKGLVDSVVESNMRISTSELEGKIEKCASQDTSRSTFLKEFEHKLEDITCTTSSCEKNKVAAAVALGHEQGKWNKEVSYHKWTTVWATLGVVSGIVGCVIAGDGCKLPGKS